jgi:PAS domain S-box-containing protein
MARDSEGLPSASDAEAWWSGLLLEAIPQLLWTAQPDGQLAYLNQRWTEYTGLSYQESVGQGWQQAVHPDDRARCLRAWEGSVASGTTFEIEFRLRAGDGSYRRFLGRGVPVRGTAGAVERWLGTWTDVDNTVSAEETRARLAAIVESSDDAIVSKSLEGIVTSWNGGAERIFGYTAAETVGRSIERLLPPDRRGEEQEILRRLRRGERVDHFESVRVTRDGRLIDVSLTISPVRDASGRIIGASKIARDIADQKRVQKELKAAKEAAEEANRAKDRFLAMLSHELRTPLTPLLASVSHLADRSDLSGELRDELISIRSLVENEARVIDDLLEIMQITRGKLERGRKVLDAHEVVREAVEVCREAITAGRLSLTLKMQAEAHHVQADPARVQQTLRHLIQNAVKFTPEGGSINLQTSNPGPQRLAIEIADTGVGIAPEALPRIFKAFEQGEQLPARHGRGLGLGLAIAKGIVELHGGSITARSAGQSGGSVFTIELPTVPAPAPAALAAPSAPEIADPGRVLKVLLVEDNAETLRVITRLLQHRGLDVESASTVQAALQMASEQSFDLVVCDIGLPDGSGLEVMRHVRKRYGLRGIAFSGYGTDEDLRASHEAGFTHHLTKPVRIDELVGLIHLVAS